MASGKSRRKAAKPKTRKQKTPKAATVSVISQKIDKLEDKIDLLRKQQEKTEDDVEESLKDADEVEKEVEHIEKDIGKLEEEVVNIGRLTMKKRHFAELVRGVAGAFLGVGIGMGMRLVPIMAEKVEWSNAVGILAFIFLLGAMLIYKNEKDIIKEKGNIFVAKRLTVLFIISLCVEIVALYLFNLMPADPDLAIRALIVGSYPAMSGAITFSIS